MEIGIKGLGPLLVIVVASIGTISASCLQKGLSARSLYLSMIKSLPLTNIIAFLCVASVSMTIFQSWLGVEYQFDGRDPDETISHFYLRNDRNIRCSHGEFSSAEHNDITSTALILMWVWPMGIVAFYTALLLPSGSSIRAHVQTPLIQATRFIHRDCACGTRMLVSAAACISCGLLSCNLCLLVADKPDFFYWELIELIRR